MAFFVSALWGGSALLLVNLDDRGQYGDMFGAVNSLFSGLAFAALIVTLLMQKKELEDNRLELKRSADAQKKNATLLALTTLLSEYNEQLDRRVKDLTDASEHAEHNEAYIEGMTKEATKYRVKKVVAIMSIESILKEEGIDVNA